MIRLLSVPYENRSIMARWREGLTAEQFTDAMWARRDAAQSERNRTGFYHFSDEVKRWPFVRLENQEPIAEPATVTPIRKRGKA